MQNELETVGAAQGTPVALGAVQALLPRTPAESRQLRKICDSQVHTRACARPPPTHLHLTLAAL
jgi:hypothetical protein